MRPWDYNVNQTRSLLEQLRDRFFRSVITYPEGHLTHFGDCETHRSMDIYKYAPCTCGLLHDLRHIDHGLALKIFPSMQDDLARQDAMIPGHRYWTGPPSEEEKRQMQETFDKLFPLEKIVSPTIEEYEQMELRDWTLIEEVFGKPFRDRMEVLWQSQDGIE